MLWKYQSQKKTEREMEIKVSPVRKCSILNKLASSATRPNVSDFIIPAAF